MARTKQTAKKITGQSADRIVLLSTLQDTNPEPTPSEHPGAIPGHAAIPVIDSVADDLMEIDAGGNVDRDMVSTYTSYHSQSSFITSGALDARMVAI
jgi:hypothetical protein